GGFSVFEKYLKHGSVFLLFFSLFLGALFVFWFLVKRCLAGLASWSGEQAGRFNLTSFNEISHGMPEEEVRRILGPHHERERPGNNNAFVLLSLEEARGTELEVLVWKNDSDNIKVFFVSGRVEGKSCQFGATSLLQQGPTNPTPVNS